MRVDDYVVDVLMRDLTGHDRMPSAFLVYLFLWSQTWGRRRKSSLQSYQDIANATGLSKSSAQAAVRRLLRRHLVAQSKPTPTATPRYTVLRPWHRAKPQGK